MRIVLASGSPRRRELLSELGIPFEVAPSNCDESVAPGTSPDAAVRELALRKARSVAHQQGESLVIGSDTVIDLDGDIVGKPQDEADAFTILSRMQGRSHLVRTGVAVLQSSTGESAVEVACSEILFRPLSEADIWAYVKTGEPMDKAGAYAIQGIGRRLVESFTGEETTIIGFPLGLVQELLERFDVLARRPDVEAGR